ncbi:P-loop containing nucleoside triphosphate hydrolase [Sesbania bispinosa]|nr:P-loop containing nucleoside triphosphate hydrolase [Sesbania bispinosa]
MDPCSSVKGRIGHSMVFNAEWFSSNTIVHRIINEPTTAKFSGMVDHGINFFYIMKKNFEVIPYVDEINLLDEGISNFLLNVLTEEVNTVEREGISFRYPCRPLLIATYNPDEGSVREHLLDRIAIDLSADLPMSFESHVAAVATEFQENSSEVFKMFEDETENAKTHIILASGLAYGLPKLVKSEGVSRLCKEVLYCAKKAGVTHVLKAGGAQAISAMAWGTETCPKVEKIFGLGNQYDTAAKMIMQNSEAMVAIDMPAGSYGFQRQHGYLISLYGVNGENKSSAAPTIGQLGSVFRQAKHIRNISSRE